MNISIASDHAGFEQKQALVDYLAAKGHDVIDRGPDTDDRVDYPDYAALVARDVAGGAAERGVLVCGTGIGMAVAANKVDGIRAANVVTPQFAALCARAQRRERRRALRPLRGRGDEPRASSTRSSSTPFGERPPRRPRGEDHGPRSQVRPNRRPAPAQPVRAVALA